MARGRFGRRRKSGQNLTAFIASLLREQHAAEDRAMADAWQNGGLVDGKPVTDARYIAYAKSRRDGFSQDDPLYDQWNNHVIQTEFTVGEQKIGLAFKQGKVGAGAVAAFYRGQLGKIPKDSAFYREVAGRAADWAKSAAGSARGGARSRAGKAISGKIDAQENVVAQYDALEQLLTDVARRAGFIAGTQTLTDASAANIERLFDMGLTFGNQPVTYETWRGAAEKSYLAQRQIIVLSEQAGRTTKTKRNQLQKFIDQTLVRANAVDDRAKYEAARTQFESDMDGTNDPRKALEITKAYLATLTAIREGAAVPSEGQTNDPEFIGGIGNEITALSTGKAGGPTVTDLQSNTGEGVVTRDAERLALLMNDPAHNTGILVDFEKLRTGTGFYGQSEPGDALEVIDYPANAAMDPTGRNGLDRSFTQAVVEEDGEPSVVMLKGAAVLATVLLVNGSPSSPEAFEPGELAKRLADGTATMQTTDQSLGYVYTQPGGKVTYGVVTPDGILFTETNPFDGLALGEKDTFTVLTGDAVVAGKGYQFGATAGLNERAIAVRNGQSVPGMTFDPLLADSRIPPSEIGSLLAESSDERVITMVADRRAEAQASSELRRARQFGEKIPGQPLAHLQKGFELASPLSQLLGPTVNVLGDALKMFTLPQQPPDMARDLFGPPPSLGGGVGGATAPPPIGGGVGGLTPPPVSGGVGGATKPPEVPLSGGVGGVSSGGGAAAKTTTTVKPRRRTPTLAL
jgi:hypothetical protein